MPTPNIYTLTGPGLTITYHPAQGSLVYNGPGSLGQPETKTFTAPQLTSLSTEIGTLVTFPTRTSIDTGATLLSVLLPFIELAQPNHPQAFNTIGIDTVVKGPNSFPHNGPADFYSTIALSGVANHLLIVPLPHAAAVASL